ncbi:MAG: PEP-CTERM sorting domain-containing protein [Thiobacillus sp.]|nr:PEP-CTERM sorting domain-containing protein [Thiobacillus sp.]MDP1926102.1 PEP-CTERM sorting domain-containing protein [Thiobacillus sp.]
MTFNMTQIAAAVVLSATAMSAQAVSLATLDFSDSLGGTFTSSIWTTGAGAAAFTAGNEFRMISGLNGLTNGQKNTMSGDEVWDFATTQLSSVTGSGLVGVAPSSTHCPAGGCTGIDDGALFFGDLFGFLAPTAGNTIGLTPATITVGGTAIGDTFSVLMPLAEAHWGAARFPMAGVTFNGVFTNATGGFVMTAEHTIASGEDPDAAGFEGFTAQWRYEGVATVAAAPIPEASTYGMMLAGLGLVGFAVRRRNKA